MYRKHEPDLPGAHGAEWVVVAASLLTATLLGYGIHTLLGLLTVR